jgi:hypothetical protein
MVQGKWLVLEADLLNSNEMIIDSKQNYILLFVGGGMATIEKAELIRYKAGKQK